MNTYEAGTYIPSPQEENSWKKRQQQVLSEGLRDEAKKSTPFAFDLGREYQLAQEFGEPYKKYFIENAYYYAKESYGKVPVSEYEHKIITDSEGKQRLALGPDNQLARDSYLQPALDTSKPEWFQERSMGDVRWVDSMEEKLNNAQDGDTFVDLSPTVYDVTVEERKKWGYGYHSFARLHRVVTENGQKKLVSRAIRNYLDRNEQEDLFYKLTEEQVNANDMLGRVEKVNPGMSPAYVRALSDALYEATPHDRKIVPPDSYIGNMKSEGDMNEALIKTKKWLTAIYEMMERGESPYTLLGNFRGWENAVKDYVAGKTTLDEFSEVSMHDMRMAMYQRESVVGGYVERIYEPGSNGCGLGSGMEMPDRNKGTMNYDSMTNSTDMCPEIKCRKCSWKANEKEAKKIADGKLKECPDCGWAP